MNINDPVLGRLESSDSGWIGSVALKGLFSSPLTVRVRGHRHQPPGAVEQRAFQWLLQRLHTLRPALELALTTYYEETVLPARADVLSQIDRNGDGLKDSSSIWELVTARNVRLGDERGHPEMVFIGFDAMWDDEHGVDVCLLEDGIGVGIEAAHWADYLQFDLKGERVLARDDL